jgi:hypothetical protein
MKNFKWFILIFVCAGTLSCFAQDTPYIHPNTKQQGWEDVFSKGLTNGIFPAGVWTDSAGVFTASQDEALWSKDQYDDFVLDLDFKNAESTNSGVIVHASDIVEWIPHSVEIQIADDYSKKWSDVSPDWQCGAVFGHKPATNKSLKPHGEWNHYTITCRGKMIWIVLNGTLVNECNMAMYTSAKTNPDGSAIPAWLSNPMASLPLHGHIGFQGKHAGAPIYFKNIKIKKLG